MARADLLKQLFRAYRDSDREAFLKVATCIAHEERKKNHFFLADELLGILNNGVASTSPKLLDPLHPAPRDQEKNTPLLEVRRTDRYLNEMVLNPDFRERLGRVMREFQEWDVLEANGLRPSNKILFCGPPGCGKTATAEAISTELGLPLVYIRFDSVISSLLGETAANLRRVFEYIRQETWVVLFDEFDAIGRSRDDVTEHGEIKRVVNSFLQLLDSFEGRSLLIAATNFEQVLDPALWRRFDEIARFDRPSEAQIEELLKKRLQLVKNPRVSMQKYVSQLKGSTFGEVERVTTDILKTCALDGRTRLRSDDIEKAIDSQTLRRQVLDRSRSSSIPRVSSP